MLYLVNSFSLGMLKNKEGKFSYKQISLQEAQNLVRQEFISAVGHQATAELMSTLLGIPVSYNRVEISLSPGDILLVLQLLVRIEEGKVLSIEDMKELLKEEKIVFYKVEILC